MVSFPGYAMNDERHPPPTFHRPAPRAGPVCDRCGCDRAHAGWRAFADGAQVCAACWDELEAVPAPSPARRAAGRSGS